MIGTALVLMEFKLTFPRWIFSMKNAQPSVSRCWTKRTHCSFVEALSDTRDKTIPNLEEWRVLSDSFTKQAFLWMLEDSARKIQWGYPDISFWKDMSNFILHALSIGHSLKTSFSHPLSQVFPFLVIPGTQTGSFRAHIPALAFLPGIWTHHKAQVSCLQLRCGWGCGGGVAPFHGCWGTL